MYIFFVVGLKRRIITPFSVVRASLLEVLPWHYAQVKVGFGQASLEVEGL
jgi:hypothetical protein